MRKLISLVSSIALVALLHACGGSDDPAPTTPPITTTTAAKYAGTWSACVSTGATSSRRETIVITRQTDQTASFAYSEANHTAAACGGTAGPTTTDTGTIAFAGTKTIGTETVDKGTVTQVGQPTQKQVFAVRGTAPMVLVFGVDAGGGGALDAEGFPNTLEPNGLTKQ